MALVLFLTLIFLKSKQKSDRLRLFYHPQSEIHKKVIEKSKLKNMAFIPSILLPNGNLQSLMNPLMKNIAKKNSRIIYQRELFKLKDGGTIALDWGDEITIHRHK